MLLLEELPVSAANAGVARRVTIRTARTDAKIFFMINASFMFFTDKNNKGGIMQQQNKY